MDTSTRYAYIRSTKKKAMFGDQASGRRDLGETLSGCSCEGLGQSFGSAPREDGTVMPGIVYFTDDGSTGSVSTLEVAYTDKNNKFKVGVPFREPKPAPIPPGGWGMQDMHGARMIMGASIKQEAGVGKFKIEDDGQVSEEATTKLSTFDSGFITRGVVMRDVRSKSLGKQDDAVIDHDKGNLNIVYSAIGRNPYRPVSKLFSSGIGMFPPLNRNPPLSEKIEVLFEYPKEYYVSKEDVETDLLYTGTEAPDPNGFKTVEAFMNHIGRSTGLAGKKEVFANSDTRTNKRYNVFNFEDPNKLIERIEGTGVDFYGNVIDINRQLVAIKESDGSSTNTQNREMIKTLNKKHRHGLVYHFEINSRKETDERDANEFLRKDISRWSFDIDKEGLTKFNIPANSEIGSVPILTRYKANELYKGKIDINIEDMQFGTQLAGDYEKPPGYDYTGITIAGTNLIHNAAYHNVLTTASRIIANSSYAAVAGPTFSSLLSVKNLISKEDCGGRSFLGNLDGSLEMSVGADTIDKKSLVLDTAGAIINRIGRDKNGRSIVTQTDGDMIIQIGGMGPRDSGTSPDLKDPSTNRDPRFSDEDNSFRAGALILQIVTSESHESRSKVATGPSSAPSSVTQDQFIRITKDGMEVFVNGNLVFDVSGHIEMAAQGDVNIRGSGVKVQSAHAGGGAGAPASAFSPGVPGVQWVGSK